MKCACSFLISGIRVLYKFLNGVVVDGCVCVVGEVTGRNYNGGILFLFYYFILIYILQFLFIYNNIFNIYIQ